MIKSQALIILLLSLILMSCEGKKTICFTIDDLPIVNYGMNDIDFQMNVSDNLINSFIRNDIPAIGFVNGIKVYNRDTLIQYRYKMLENWLDAGLELGNHTYSHPSYHKVSMDTYGKNIVKNEPYLKNLLNRHGQSLKYFRHPYLHSGYNQEKADSLRHFLNNHNYTVAPVTIDNDDYLFALAYKRAKVAGNDSLAMRIGHDYINYMEAKTKYFENQTRRLFNRNISHILLFHASWLNSVYVDSLAKMYRDNNYKFISLEEALKDPVYETEETVFSNWGISWLDRWALSKGKQGDFFKDDPKTPGYIISLTK